MANNIVDATRQVNTLTEAFDKHERALREANAVLQSLNKEYAKVPSDFIRTQKEIAQLDREQARTKQQLIRVTTEEERLRTQKARALTAEARLQKTTNNETQRATRVTRTNVAQIRSLNNRYQQQRRLLRTLVARQRELNLSKIQGNRLTALQRMELQALSARITILNGQLREAGRTGPRSFRLIGTTLRQLVGGLGAIEIARRAFDFTKEAVQTSLAARGVRIAFNQLGEAGVKAFSDVRRATRNSLSDLDIQRSLVQFNNLGISVDDAGTAFEFLTLRSTQTGESITKLQNDLVTGLGRESAQILDNLGISMSELKQITDEQGVSITEAFGIIAQREIAKAGDLINASGTSAETLNASIENTKLAFGDLITSQGFGVLDIVVNFFDRITAGFRAFQSALGTLTRGIQAFLAPFREILAQFPVLNRLFDTASSRIGTFLKLITSPGLIVFSNILKAIGATLSGLGAAISQARNSFVRFFIEFAKIADLELGLNPITNARKLAAFGRNLARTAREEGQGIGQAFSQAFNDALNFEPEPETAGGAIGTAPTRTAGTTPASDKVKRATEEQIQAIQRLLADFRQADEDFTAAAEAEAQKRIDIRKREDDALKQLEKDRRARQEADAAAEAERLRKQQDAVTTVFNSFAGLYNIDASRFTALFDQKNADIGTYVDAAAEGIRFILSLTTQSFDEELQANQDRLQQILDNENASEQQKEAARRRAEQTEKRIRQRQARAERDNALFQIGIDTASGIVKAIATPPVPNFLLGGIVAGIGAAQLAFVASQELPSFQHGTENAPQGWAITQEVGPEIITDKYNRIKSLGSYGGDTLTYLEKGDKVIPTHKREQFFQEDITRAAIMTSLANDQYKLSALELGDVFDRHLSTMKRDVKQGVKEGLKGFKNNIKINNKVDLGHLAWLAKKGY